MNFTEQIRGSGLRSKGSSFSKLATVAVKGILNYVKERYSLRKRRLFPRTKAPSNITYRIYQGPAEEVLCCGYAAGAHCHERSRLLLDGAWC
jgi:hypothetical protein